jgi:hypothetical protein
MLALAFIDASQSSLYYSKSLEISFIVSGLFSIAIFEYFS